MSVQYYIVQGGAKTGPYDLVALIRKIRNGSLTAETPLQLEDDSPAKAAKEWPALAEFFADKKEEKQELASRINIRALSLGMAMQEGWAFLQRNQVSTVFSGFMVLLIIVMIAFIRTGFPPSLRLGSYMGVFVLSYFLLSCYMLVVLRMTRSQPVDLQYLLKKIRPALKSLLVSSFFICLPSMVGLLLVLNGITSKDAAHGGSIMLPKINVWELNTNIGGGIDPMILSIVGLIIFVFGIYVLTLYVFTPLLILEHGKSLWEAMEMSREAVLKSGTETIGVLFALFVINFLAGLCALLPLALTFPITMSPIAVIFDEQFG